MATMITDSEKRIKDLYDAYNAHDLEKFLALHTDDIFYEQVVADGVAVHGKDEYRKFMESSFAALPDMKCEPKNIFTVGNWQCEEAVFTGTHTDGPFFGIPPTGKSYSFRTVLIRELREGKTCRLSIYWDNVTALRQLGAK